MTFRAEGYGAAEPTKPALPGLSKDNRSSDNAVVNESNGRSFGRILACASQGNGSNDEARLRALVHGFDAEFVKFNRSRKIRSFVECLSRIVFSNSSLFLLEGTGIAAGVPAILGRLLFRREYVFSSGDAVTPYLSMKFPLGAPLFYAYERLLFRFCSGFIGWTPYLVGRALTLGAKRAVTIPGWAQHVQNAADLDLHRSEIRRKLGIPENAIVFGLIGSLNWSKRTKSCYGSELVQAAARAGNNPYVLVVGDGSGLSQLKILAGEALNRNVFLPGRVDRELIPEYIAAMDFGSLPQSTDGIGSFRYTTKISEYRDVGLPFATAQIPMAYDLDRGDIWRLPGEGPWADEYIDAMAALMREMTFEVLAQRKAAVSDSRDFNEKDQLARVTSFLVDVLAAVSVK